MTVNKTRKYTQSQIKKANNTDLATKDIFFHNLTKVDDDDDESNGIFTLFENEEITQKGIKKKIKKEKKKVGETCPNNKYPFDHFMVALKIQHDAKKTKDDAALKAKDNKMQETDKMTNEIAQKVIDGINMTNQTGIIVENVIAGINKTQNATTLNLKESKISKGKNNDFELGGGSLRKRSHKNNKRLLFTRKRSNKKNKKYSFINNNKMRGGIKKSKLRNINFKKSRKNQKLSHKRL